MLKSVASAVVLAVAILASSACWSSGPEATDAQIRSEIATSIDAANIKGVSVSVIDGQVTLTGTVPDQATSDKIAGIAKAANGAKGVTNQLVVSGGGGTDQGPGGPPPPPPPVNSEDEILAAKVNQRLVATPELAGGRVVSTAASGVVTLTGTAPTDAGKAAAEKVAKSVPGVASVVNQILVEAPKVPAITVPDAQLTDQINELLDKQFPDLTLFVTVVGGKVSLNGAVPNRGVIVQVSNAIHAVPGVKAVDTSHLTVQGNTEGSDTIGAPSTKVP